MKTRTRPNGSGTAYKRNGKWTARVVVGWKIQENGNATPIRRTKDGFATKREALEYCAILKGDNKKKSPPKLIEYWDTYSTGEFQKLSKSKQVAYRTAWRKLSALYYRPVDQISVPEIREAVSAAASTYYPAKDCKAVLTRLFELAGADGWCSKDIPSYIVLPPLEEEERTPFSAEEQEALWKLYDSGDIRAAVPLLMIATGMMPGEMMDLRIEHINLETRTVTGVGLKTKTRKSKSVIIPTDAVPLVEDLLANARPSGYVFKRNEKEWYDNYYAALEAAGCRRLTPYSCRHTTATRLAITEGIAPQTVQRVMRWSSSKMLDRYAHPDESDAFAAAETIRRSRQ